MLLPVKEIIITTWNLYKENSKVFLQYVLLYFFTGATAAILFALFMPDEQGNPLIELGSNATLAVIYIIAIIAIIVHFWISIALTREIHASYVKKGRKSITEMLQDSGRLIIPTAITYFIYGILTILGFFLFIIPGIIFSIWFLFAKYHVMLDDSKIIDSFKQSKAHVDGRWFPVFWRIIGPLLFYAILTSIILTILEFIFTKGVSPFLATTSTAITAIILYALLIMLLYALFTPLSTAVYIVVKNELEKKPLQKS